MRNEECVMKWIKETFDDLSEVTIEDYNRLPCGKKITDCTDDYVIVYYDDEKDRVNFLFKEN
ncbi:hypothetical protein [Lentibacillus amyloliquefaciens]|uniref:Uncharacterized protein n=1 Tax=Lentibacillus amyloliquefaciens TaxID=1472767 RepID=A0A0U3NL44_9BACI|nr:hypothetical protein [Lentibacillus amyloliquefaciens]ALX47515.1 hypothetical protein AOX59_02195 [Lentibacillus amyloliquefaciens]